MLFKRLCGVLLIGLMLSGCGVSDQPVATATPPATPTSRPTATVRPTATIVAEAGSSSSADTTIPAPPGSVEIDESGDSPQAAFVGAVKPALEPELSRQQVSLDTQTYYSTPRSIAEIESFYEKEMQARGWKQDETQRQTGITVQTFTSGDNVALIMIVDGAQFDSDNIVGAINASKGSSTAENQPTSTSSQATPLTSDVPAPPGGVEIDESGDSPQAAFVGAVKPALEPELSRQQVSLDTQTYYSTPRSIAEIESFYEKEMQARGWKQEETQRQPGILVQTFTAGDTATLIMLVDGSQFASDNIVGVIRASK